MFQNSPPCKGLWHLVFFCYSSAISELVHSTVTFMTSSCRVMELHESCDFYSFFISGAYDSSDEHLALGVICSVVFQPQTDTLAPGHCRTSQSCSVLLCLALHNCWIKGRQGMNQTMTGNLGITAMLQRGTSSLSLTPACLSHGPMPAGGTKRRLVPLRPMPVSRGSIELFSDVFRAEKGNSPSLSWVTLFSVKQAHMSSY